MSTPITPSRPVIDVSALPDSRLDHRASIWWGNLLLLCIESMMFVLLFASYFYYRQNFHQWPPVQSNWTVGRTSTDPAPLWGTINLVVILASCVPMAWADRAALRLNERGVGWGLVFAVLLFLGAIALRFREFFSLNFRWDDNAYASTVWTILGLHLTHLAVGTLENAIMIAWMVRHGLDAKHARDVRVNAVYWYWIAAMWVITYLIVYWSPKLL